MGNAVDEGDALGRLDEAGAVVAGKATKPRQTMRSARNPVVKTVRKS